MCVSQDLPFWTCCFPAGANSWGQSWVRNLNLIPIFYSMFLHLTKNTQNKCILIRIWRTEDINHNFLYLSKDDYTVMKSLYNICTGASLILSALITQKFIRVKVLLWNRTMSAVRPDLWDWPVWGERNLFICQMQETDNKLTRARLFMSLRFVTMTLWNGLRPRSRPSSWRSQQWEPSDDCINTSLAPMRKVWVCVCVCPIIYLWAVFKRNEHIQYKEQKTWKIRTAHHVHTRCSGSTLPTRDIQNAWQKCFKVFRRNERFYLESFL